MEKHHEEILRKNRRLLMRELSAGRLASDLLAVNVFDQEDVHEVKASSTPEQKAETLLELLVKRGPEAFPRFHDLLKKTSPHLADKLVPPHSEMDDVTDGINVKAAGLPCRNVNFVGREELCRKVILYVKTGHQLIVVSAPPGYGKSEATTTIGHMLLEEGFVVLYFSLKNRTTLYDASVFILETLRTVVSTNPVLQLQQFLKSICKRTILILDNTENVQEKENEMFLEFLKETGKFAHNLCTVVTTTEALSQTMLYPRSFAAISIPLQPLSDKESLSLFNKYATNVAIPTTYAKQLCKACMEIPLFLEIAASQVQNGADIVLLIKDLESNPQLLLQKNEGMKVFFSRLPNNLKVVLAYLAVFPSSFTIDEARLLFVDPVQMMADFDLHYELCKLIGYALLKFDEERKSYQLHNVIQSFCKSDIDEVIFDSYKRAVKKFIELHLTSLQDINILFISPNSKDALEKYSQNKTNILSALSLAIEYEHELAIDVSTEVVNLLAKCLNIKEFEKIYQGFADKAFAKKDMKRYSDCQTSIGFKLLCYHGKESSREAFDVLFEAEQVQRSSNLPETEERAHCMSKLGLCCARLGNVERGVELIVKGIVIRKKLHEREGGAIKEMLVYGGYCDLAMTLYEIEKFKAAVKIWETICLDGYRCIMGSHPFTATLLQYIGDAYHKLEKHEIAKKYKRKALEMRKLLLTTNHQDTARSFSSLAQTLEMLGKSQEAVEMLKETLSIQSKVLASPEDISATQREIHRLQTVDVCRMMGRCSIHGNRMTSSSGVLGVPLPPLK